MYKQKLHHFCNTSFPDDGQRLGRKYWGNYGKFINQFLQNIMRSIRQFKRINKKKICRQKMSIMSNQISIKEEMLSIYIYIPDIGLAVRVFANGPGDLGSIPGRVIPKTQKMVLDASLLNTQHYKVQIKGKVEQSRERSSALPYALV